MKSRIMKYFCFLLLFFGIALLCYPKCREAYQEYRVNRESPFGLIHMESLDITVRLFEADGKLDRQTIVDVEDAAAIFMINDVLFVADHDYQAFAELDNLQVGDTVRIHQNEGNYDFIYTCLETAYAKRKSNEIYIHGSSVYQYKDRLILYTCTEVEDTVFCAVLKLNDAKMEE